MTAIERLAASRWRNCFITSWRFVRKRSRALRALLNAAPRRRVNPQRCGVVCRQVYEAAVCQQAGRTPEVIRNRVSALWPASETGATRWSM